jgi:ABC-2 type transport system permease protein
MTPPSPTIKAATPEATIGQIWLFAPGSLAWLIRHQFRTKLRGKQSKGWLRPLLSAVFIILVLAGLMASMGVMLLTSLQSIKPGELETFTGRAGFYLLAYALTTLGATITASYMHFTDRGDLDLLLSAPFAERKIVIARMIMPILTSLSVWWGLATAFLGPAILFAEPRLLGVYPVLLGFMLFETALAFALARALLVRLGLRAGRRVSMICGTALMIVGVLFLQANLLKDTRLVQWAVAAMEGTPAALLLQNFLKAIGSLALGNLAGIAIVFFGGAVVFWLVARWLAPRFREDVASLSGQEGQVAINPRRAQRRFAHGSVSVLLRKEWLNMARDPFVLTQMIVPLVPLLPAGFALGRLEANPELANSPFGNMALGFQAFLIVQFSGQIATSLAWVVASVEEASDLLVSSPTTGRTVFWSKVLAAALPAIGFMGLGCVLLGLSSLFAAFWTFAIGLIGVCCTASIEFCRPRPTKRVKMTQRPDRSPLSIMIGLVLCMIWGAAAGLAVYGTWWTLLPVGLGVFVTAWAAASAPKTVIWMSQRPADVPQGGAWGQAKV